MAGKVWDVKVTDFSVICNGVVAGTDECGCAGKTQSSGAGVEQGSKGPHIGVG